MCGGNHPTTGFLIAVSSHYAETEERILPSQILHTSASNSSRWSGSCITYPVVSGLNQIQLHSFFLNWTEKERKLQSVILNVLTLHCLSRIRSWGDHVLYDVKTVNFHLCRSFKHMDKEKPLLSCTSTMEKQTNCIGIIYVNCIIRVNCGLRCSQNNFKLAYVMYKTTIFKIIFSSMGILSKPLKMTSAFVWTEV